MDYPAKRKYILDKLKENVRVAVEYDGYESGLSPDKYFDALESSNSLSKLEDVIARSKYLISQRFPGIEKMDEKIKEILGDLNDYSDFLAKNAEISETDVAKVEDKVFKAQAKIFEKRNKEKLVVSTPDFFIALNRLYSAI